MRRLVLSARSWGAALLALGLVLTALPAGAQEPVVPPTGAQERLVPPTGAPPQRALPPELRESPVGGEVPGGTLGATSDSELWRQLRHGAHGAVSLRDPQAATLIQSGGEIWRDVRNDTVPRYGAWAMLGMIVVLAVLFAALGRVKIEHGRSGVTITRFTTLERAGHWLTAVSFIILALTGLNIMYGRSAILPIIGYDAFSAISLWSKYLHNYVAFAFMAGLVFIFVAWVRHNLPSWNDVVWVAKGGGILVRGVHVPARKFNAGQKLVFWLTILGGASISLSGWALLFPFTTQFFTHTMDAFLWLGIDMPSWLGLPPPPYTPIMEQQLNQVWHAIIGLVLTTLIIGHIYIGTMGMEGAFEAMGSGEVDLNWAREHHNLWVEEIEQKMAREAQEPEPQAGQAQPAE